MGIIIGSILLTSIGILNGPPTQVSAQPSKDDGAAGFTPAEDPKIPGWDPDRAEEDAPGHCIGCSAAEDNPGQEAQEAGIIGPHLKD